MCFGVIQHSHTPFRRPSFVLLFNVDARSIRGRVATKEAARTLRSWILQGALLAIGNHIAWQTRSVPVSQEGLQARTVEQWR